MREKEPLYKNGALITFEGGDGSGKGTQSKLLYERLYKAGAPVKFETIPRYNTPTGQKVAAYLNGEMGTDVDARVASKLFSDDRLAFKEEMVDWMENGGFWVLDRYVDSNKGHQGGKLATEEERLAFFKESDQIEFVRNGLPVPDATILFTVPPELAQTYIDQKMARSYTARKRDIHEADPHHLQNANESFLLFAKQNPDRVMHINPAEADNLSMRSREAIHQDVIRALRPLFELRGVQYP